MLCHGSCGRQSGAFLQQLDGDAVRRAHERHAAVARRPVDDHAVLGETAARRIDVVHLVGKVPERAARTVRLWIPVLGELDLRGLVTRRRQEHQREAPLGIVVAAHFAQAERVAVELQGLA